MTMITNKLPLICVVDDDDLVRIALCRLLTAAGYEVVAFSTATQFLTAEVGRLIGCLLLDVNMPGLDGLSLQQQLKSKGLEIPIIFISGVGDIPMSVRAIKAGASDFLVKPLNKDALLEAIEKALKQFLRVQGEGDKLQALKTAFERLTPREREVFYLVAAGLRNKQISSELGNTERTVKAHRRAIMEKLGLNSLAELVLLAARLHLIGGESVKEEKAVALQYPQQERISAHQSKC